MVATRTLALAAIAPIVVMADPGFLLGIPIPLPVPIPIVLNLPLLGVTLPILTQGSHAPHNYLNGLTGLVRKVLSDLKNIQGNLAAQAPVLAGNTTGTIKISGASNGYLGRQGFDAYGAIYQLIPDAANAITVTVPSKTCATLPSLWNLYGTLAPGYAAYQNIAVGTFNGAGETASNLNYAIDRSNSGYGFIVASNQTAAKTYAGSETSLGFGIGGESAVWSINCLTKEISATWTQKDGSQSPLSILDYYNGVLTPVANVSAFNAEFQNKPNPNGGLNNVAGTPLTLTFVPSNSTLLF